MATTQREEEEKALRYTKVSPHEHVLLRPDTYVGNVNSVTESVWVHYSETNQVHTENVEYSPAFVKLVDEILVNAADNKQRHPATTTEIRMKVIASTGEVEISNNGDSIPIIEHPKFQTRVPEVIFGSLLSGSNFDDKEEKTTGGRNGYGAKLVNVFSKRFEVEIVYAGKEYLQLFEENMFVTHPPVIRDFVLPEGVQDVMPNTRGMSKKEAADRVLHRHDRVTVRFTADFERLNMAVPCQEKPVHPDLIRLLRRRAMDIAGTLTRFTTPKNPFQVVFEEFASPTGEKVSSDVFQFKSFRDYILCYPSLADTDRLLFMERINENWEVGVALGNSSSLQQLSFVNSIHTMSGGTHVNHVVDQVVKYIQDVVCVKKKISKLRPQTIKSFLTVFVNAVVVNPTFGEQTKTSLTTAVKHFRPNTCELYSHKCMEKLLSCTKLVGYLTGKYFSEQEQELSKQMSSSKRDSLLDIVKLDDARLAGTSKGYLATLVLTEGDSAFSLFKSAQRVIGSDLWGGLPLKGKIMNVRGAGKVDQIMKNEEIRNLVRVLGLKMGKEYNTEADIKSLRYGHLMIMTDQDHDGSHIKGLLINLLHYFWPNLLKIKGFIKDFQTPLKKLTLKDDRELAGYENEYSFFTEKEFQAWVADFPPEVLSKYLVKYYKGLGTSTALEACQYFANMAKHQFVYEFEDEEGGRLTHDLIDMAFRQSRADDRKSWLLNRDPNAELQVSMKPLTEIGEAESAATQLVKHITFSNFFGSSLIDYSLADVFRSIGHCFDGLKPSQRKVLFGCFKRNLKTDLKVAQLGGYISEHASYHHGETSLHETIIGMAQNFIGANNIQLLCPSGQFGTRLFGGKDSASPRYIFTRLEKITRALFSAEDDPLLEYLVDDGQTIEPRYYMPVIPMVLVNGCTGIGTGWSTFIPQFNPREIINVTKTFVHRLLSTHYSADVDACLETCFGESAPPLNLRPWYRGFTGEITEYDSDKKRFALYGKVERVDGDCSKFLITELPVGVWTKQYREQYLNKWDSRIEPEKKKASAAAGGGGDDARSVSSADGSESRFIKDIQEYNTNVAVKFYVECDEDRLYGNGRLRPDASDRDLAVFFKLRTYLSMNNMHLFNERGVIEKFPNVESIFAKFCGARLALYEKRKVYLVRELQYEASVAQNKIRFISMAADGEIDLRRRERRELEAQLAGLGFLAVRESEKKKKTAAKKKEEEASEEAAAEEGGGGEGEGEGEAEDLAGGYDYLLNMPISSLTIQRVQYWKSVSDKKERELAELSETPVARLWLRDLEKLEDALTEFEEGQERIHRKVAHCEEVYHQGKGGGGKGGAKGKAKRKSATEEEGGGAKAAAVKKRAKTVVA